jgi:SAM-dependent methyltransferase
VIAGGYVTKWFGSRDAGKPKAWLTPEEDALVPPRELWLGPDDSISHYYRWPWEYLAYLTLLAGLRRTSSVLELGCGHGRTARGLLEYLRSPGSYVGLDVDGSRIRDAQQRITARWPNFCFIHADVFNRQYNARSVARAEYYRFPLEKCSVDVIYAASLFTHLLPAEVEHYFRESARLLRPGGCCLFSMFVLDYYRGAGTTTSPMYEFEHPLDGRPGVAVRDAECPDVAIAYRLPEIHKMAAAAGLAIDLVMPGLWSATGDWAVNEQDLIVLRRAVSC